MIRTMATNTSIIFCLMSRLCIDPNSLLAESVRPMKSLVFSCADTIFSLSYDNDDDDVMIIMIIMMMMMVMMIMMMMMIMVMIMMMIMMMMVIMMITF